MYQRTTATPPHLLQPRGPHGGTGGVVAGAGMCCGVCSGAGKARGEGTGPGRRQRGGAGTLSRAALLKDTAESTGCGKHTWLSSARAPPKATLTLLGSRLAAARWLLLRQQSHQRGGDRRRGVLAPSRVTREPRRAPTHGRFPGQAPDEATRVSPATGAGHLRSRFPAQRGTARAGGTEPGGVCTGRPGDRTGTSEPRGVRGISHNSPSGKPKPLAEQTCASDHKIGCCSGEGFRTLRFGVAKG